MEPIDQDLALSALWDEVCARFDDDRVHGAFLAACDEKKNLAFAAVRYRQIEAGEDDARKVRAREQLDKITILAFAQMESSRSAPHLPKRAMTIVAALVSFALIGFCVYLIGL